VNNKASVYIISLFILNVLGLVVLAAPPVSLAFKGYQELMLSIFQGCLIPAIGFFILRENFHRMLFLIAFPMTLHALALYLAWNFSTFAHDVTVGRMSLIRLISWQSAMPIHHILLLGAYLFFLLGYGRGLPIELIRIILLSIPLGGVLIFWMQKIKRGSRPIWPFYNVLTASVYGLSAYFMTLTLWTL
jgi:1,4-dihydroxy-2-naphthoate octaprenyltransferase